MIIRKRINGRDMDMKDREGAGFDNIERISDIDSYIAWIRDKRDIEYIS